MPSLIPVASGSLNFGFGGGGGRTGGFGRGTGTLYDGAPPLVLGVRDPPVVVEPLPLLPPPLPLPLPLLPPPVFLPVASRPGTRSSGGSIFPPGSLDRIGLLPA